MLQRSPGTLVCTFILILFWISIYACGDSPAPYPPSPVITGVTWAPTNTIIRKAKGSDNWPLTWVDDGNLYTAYGDGYGFQDIDIGEKKCMGVSKVIGGPSDFFGQDLADFLANSESIEKNENGKPCIKATGILMVDGMLYMWTRRDGGKLWKSIDHGNSFHEVGITMEQSDGSFHAIHFLQFGMNYTNTRDNFVYIYGTGNVKGAGDIFLIRVGKENIEDRTMYEFYSGLDGQGHPIWDHDISKRRPIISDPGRAQDARIVLNPGINRYILTYSWYQNFTGEMAILDAPEPWGPWTKVLYSESWSDGDQGFTFEYSFPQKWMSADGKTMYMVYSGTTGKKVDPIPDPHPNDAFVVRKLMLEVAD